MGWAPAYVTVEDLKRFTTVVDDADDVEMGLAVEAASRAVDDATGRQFGQVDTPEERRYTPRWRSGRWLVDIDDLMTVAGLTVETPTGVVGAYTLEPPNATAQGRPWTRLAIPADAVNAPTGQPYEVAITAAWGWTAIPEAVKQAAVLQANRFLARRNSPFGVAGSPQLGSELRLLARVDPDVAVILRPYVLRKWRVG